MLGSEFRIEKSEILFALTSIDFIFVKFPKESSLPAASRSAAKDYLSPLHASVPSSLDY